jgi:hypothetical protein
MIATMFAFVGAAGLFLFSRMGVPPMLFGASRHGRDARATVGTSIGRTSCHRTPGGNGNTNRSARIAPLLV